MSTMERRFDLKGKGLLFLLIFWFFWFTNMVVRLSFAPVLPLIEDEFLVTHAKASSIFIFMSMGYALSMFLSGFYAGRFGYKKSIVLSLAATSLLLFLIPFVKVFSLLYVFNFIMGASVGVLSAGGFAPHHRILCGRPLGQSHCHPRLRRPDRDILLPLDRPFSSPVFRMEGDLPGPRRDIPGECRHVLFYRP